MAKPLLPHDVFNSDIPVLGLGATLTLTSGAVSSSGVIPAEAFVVRVAAVNDCYIAFGVGSATASGTTPFFPKGSEMFKVPAGATHFACIQHTIGGAVSLTVME